MTEPTDADDGHGRAPGHPDACGQDDLDEASAGEEDRESPFRTLLDAVGICDPRERSVMATVLANARETGPVLRVALDLATAHRQPPHIAWDLLSSASKAVPGDIQRVARRILGRNRPTQMGMHTKGGETRPPLRRGRDDRADDVVGVVSDSACDEELFVPDPYDDKIIEALDGVALRGGALLKRVGKGRSTLMRRLRRLTKMGKVVNHTSVGYYRPDKTPPEYPELRSGE